MNGGQRKILLTALLVLVLSELFPPWQYEDNSTSSQRSAGYHFLARPPAPRPYEKMKEIFSIPDKDPPHHIWSHEDKFRQYLQRILLAFLTLGSLLVATPRQAFIFRVTGIMSLIIAGAFTSLLIYHALTS